MLIKRRVKQNSDNQQNKNQQKLYYDSSFTNGFSHHRVHSFGIITICRRIIVTSYVISVLS